MNEQSVEHGTVTASAIVGLRPLRLLSWKVLHGCNIHHTSTVIRQEIHLGAYAGRSTAEVGPEFVDAYLARFASLPTLLHDHGESQRLVSILSSAAGVPIVDALLGAILAIEAALASASHCPDLVSFAEPIDGDEPDRAVVVWASEAPQDSRAVAEAAVIGLNELLFRRRLRTNGLATPDYETAFAALRQKAERRRISASNFVLMQAAKRRGIPCIRPGGPHVVLGEGKYQRPVRSSTTANTSFVAAMLSFDKRLTNQRLTELRLPVPRQVRTINADDAVAAAELIGYPVVIKPAKGSQGLGITAGVANSDEVLSAFQRASKPSDDVLVEQFIEGQDHRLLVIGGQFLAASKRVPPSVIGDGNRSIGELIDKLNQDPFRDGFRLFKIAADEELKLYLQGRGFTLSSVLQVGRMLPLRTVANVSRGGLAIDVTDQVHPDNQKMAVRAALGIGLDVAGIDFITTDIGQSCKSSGGAIVEVNARPGLDLHSWPRYGRQRDVGKAVLDIIYPKDSRAHVACAAIVGDQQTAVVARDLDQFLRSAGRSVGLVIRNRAYMNGEHLDVRGGGQRRAIRMLLADPEIDTLLCTMSPGSTVSRGLRLDRTEVAAVMAPRKNADLGEYSKSLDVLLSSNPRKIVIDARNSTALEATERVARDRIVLVTWRGLTSTVRRHLASGGHAIVTEWTDGAHCINIREADRSVAMIHVAPKTLAPATAADPNVTGSTGHRSRRVEIRLFAAALAYGLGLSTDQIAEAISLAPLATK